MDGSSSKTDNFQDKKRFGGGPNMNSKKRIDCMDYDVESFSEDERGFPSEYKAITKLSTDFVQFYKKNLVSNTLKGQPLKNIAQNQKASPFMCKKSEMKMLFSFHKSKCENDARSSLLKVRTDTYPSESANSYSRIAEDYTEREKNSNYIRRHKYISEFFKCGFTPRLTMRGNTSKIKPYTRIRPKESPITVNEVRSCLEHTRNNRRFGDIVQLEMFPVRAAEVGCYHRVLGASPSLLCRYGESPNSEPFGSDISYASERSERQETGDSLATAMETANRRNYNCIANREAAYVEKRFLSANTEGDLNFCASTEDIKLLRFAQNDNFDTNRAAYETIDVMGRPSTELRNSLCTDTYPLSNNSTEIDSSLRERMENEPETSLSKTEALPQEANLPVTELRDIIETVRILQSSSDKSAIDGNKGAFEWCDIESNSILRTYSNVGLNVTSPYFMPTPDEDITKDIEMKNYDDGYMEDEPCLRYGISNNSDIEFNNDETFSEWANDKKNCDSSKNEESINFAPTLQHGNKFKICDETQITNSPSALKRKSNPACSKELNSAVQSQLVGPSTTNWQNLRGVTFCKESLAETPAAISSDCKTHIKRRREDLVNSCKETNSYSNSTVNSIRPRYILSAGDLYPRKAAVGLHSEPNYLYPNASQTGSLHHGDAPPEQQCTSQGTPLMAPINHRIVIDLQSTINPNFVFSSINPVTSKQVLSSLPLESASEAPRGTSCLVPNDLKRKIGSSIMNTFSVRLLILEWNSDWLIENHKGIDPPPFAEIGVLRQVSNSYENYEDYYNTYLPLILLETWHDIYASWNDRKDAETLECRITGVSNDRWCVAIECETASVADHRERVFPERGCILIVTYIIPATDSYVKSFGFVTEVNAESCAVDKDTGPGLVQKLTFKVAYYSMAIDTSETLRIQVLCNVKDKLKQNDALISLKHSPLRTSILNSLSKGFQSITFDPTAEEFANRISRHLTSRDQEHSLTIFRVKSDQERLTLIPLLIEKIVIDDAKVLLCVKDARQLCLLAAKICTQSSVNSAIINDRLETDPELKKYLLDYLVARITSKMKKQRAAKKENSANEARKEVLRDSDVILTLTRRSHEGFLSELFKETVTASKTCCIIDEAHLCTETESLLPIHHGIRHLILVGDPDKTASVKSDTARRRGFHRSLIHRANALENTFRQ